MAVDFACTLQLLVCAAVSWTSPAIPKLKFVLPPLSIEEESWLGSLLPLGAVFGPYFFSYLADRIGRKFTLLFISIPVMLAYLLMTFCRKLLYFYVARFISGLALGGAFAVLPIYVGELSSTSLRGFLGACITVFIACGMLFSYVLGPFVSLYIFNLVLAVLPMIFFCAFLFVGVESPHFYVANGRVNRAKEILAKLRNGTNEEIDKELSEIKYIAEKTKNGKIFDIFKNKALLKAQCICAGLVIFHQGTGINAVVSYSQQIFSETTTVISPDIASIICGTVLLFATIIATYLAHNIKRKVLLILSLIGIVITLGLLGIYLCLKERQIYSESFSFVPLLCLVSYLTAFNLGLGPLALVAQGEFFPSHLRAAAGALNASLCWLVSFLVTRFFRPMATSIGMGESFLIFAGIGVIGVVFCSIYVLETKDKSLKEIQDELCN